MRVPSTSNKTSLLVDLSAKVLGAITDGTVVLETVGGEILDEKSATTFMIGNIPR